MKSDLVDMCRVNTTNDYTCLFLWCELIEMFVTQFKTPGDMQQVAAYENQMLAPHNSQHFNGAKAMRVDNTRAFHEDLQSSKLLAAPLLHVKYILFISY